MTDDVFLEERVSRSSGNTPTDRDLQPRRRSSQQIIQAIVEGPDFESFVSTWPGYRPRSRKMPSPGVGDWPAREAAAPRPSAACPNEFALLRALARRRLGDEGGPARPVLVRAPLGQDYQLETGEAAGQVEGAFGVVCGARASQVADLEQVSLMAPAPEAW